MLNRGIRIQTFVYLLLLLAFGRRFALAAHARGRLRNVPRTFIVVVRIVERVEGRLFLFGQFDSVVVAFQRNHGPFLDLRDGSVVWLCLALVTPLLVNIVIVTAISSVVIVLLLVPGGARGGGERERKKEKERGRET